MPYSSALVWALGQPGTTGLPEIVCETVGSTTRGGETVNTSARCWDESGEGTTYLLGTPINAIAVAPDRSVWAVGGPDNDNGGFVPDHSRLMAYAATTGYR